MNVREVFSSFPLVIKIMTVCFVLFLFVCFVFVSLLLLVVVAVVVVVFLSPILLHFHVA